MSKIDKNRIRDQVIAFRVSKEEQQKIEARIMLCTMQKGEYYRKMALEGKINLVVGRYESDRLSLEIKRMRECLALMKGCDEIVSILEKTKALLEMTNELIQNNAEK